MNNLLYIYSVKNVLLHIKNVFFKKASLHKYAPYKNSDGLMKNLTLYATLDYQEPTMSWEWYENRSDLLELVRKDFTNNEVEEQFLKGRSDSLKSCIYYSAGDREKTLTFYPESRFDCLKGVVFHSSFVEEHYALRKDL